MSHSHIVADELHNAGFKVGYTNSGSIIVSLSNGKPSTMEVETALDNLFEGISFTIKSLSDSILVVVED